MVSLRKGFRCGSVILICLLFLVVDNGWSEEIPSSSSEEIPSSSVPVSQLYKEEITPLTPVQCGQCHISIYNTIKERGTKHQIDCSECHERFHIYYPGKIEYDQILPHCSDCHKEPHGKDFAGCMDCHVNAHAPAKIMGGEILEKSCGSCHAKVGKEIKARPSKHTEMACSDCHAEHALIPVCGDCHEPHTPEMTNPDCLACHPVHTPLLIAYPADTPQATCRICHQQVYGDLKESNTKHTLLTCAKCHPEHRAIMECESCHGKPHNPAIHKSFEKCQDCHGIAHSLYSQK